MEGILKKPENIPPTILTEGIKDLAPLEKWGSYLAKEDGKNKLTTSQIRKFFGAIKQIQADFENSKNEILLLEPKLAYAKGRNKNIQKMDEFYRLLSPLIRAINEDKKKFLVFVNVLEAIVAYHKSAGGE